MLLDLSEIFVCPRCRPAQGLVVLVDEIADRRVVRGHLGCPECDARFPVETGTVRFDVAGAGKSGTGGGGDDDPGGGDSPGGARGRRADAALLRGASRQEAALRLGALLGLPEAEGPFLLGPGLGGLAVALAGTVEDEEVLSMEAGAPVVRAPDGEADGGGAGDGQDGDGGDGGGDAQGDGGDAGRRVTHLVGVPGAEWPVLPGRLGGVVLLGGSAGAVEEAVRSLGEGGRVVIVGPADGVAEVVEELPVEVAARDARALVGVRRT